MPVGSDNDDDDEDTEMEGSDKSENDDYKNINLLEEYNSDNMSNTPVNNKKFEVESNKSQRKRYIFYNLECGHK